MNKSDLTKALSKEHRIPMRKAEEIVDKVFSTMVKGLVAGDRIEIRGFGVFTIRDYEGYVARNPKTGEQIAVSAKRLPFFKCGKDLRDQVSKR
jgi:integration host factor subunit beta